MTLSPVPTRSSPAAIRLGSQGLRALQFIHRFRHVTAKHVQVSLQQSSIIASRKLLTRLTRNGYLTQIYPPSYRQTNRPASYCLTASGLHELRRRLPDQHWRSTRTIQFDQQASPYTQMKRHALADVYSYFKTQLPGRFEFFSSADLAGFDYFPQELPDGYVRVTDASGQPRHYFVELYGRNRPTDVQNRRLRSYLVHAGEAVWRASLGCATPSLLLIVPSQRSQRRLQSQLASSLDDALIDDFCIFTTVETNLLTDQPAIWREVRHGVALPLA